jgi:hypothetical protein
MRQSMANLRAALDKTAEQYRQVAQHYAREGQKSRSPSVRADYQTLADAYGRRAMAAESRARATALAPAVRERAQVIEEANRFLEQVAEATAAAAQRWNEHKPGSISRDQFLIVAVAEEYTRTRNRPRLQERQFCFRETQCRRTIPGP